jgi:hypothetical protein
VLVPTSDPEAVTISRPGSHVAPQPISTSHRGNGP